MRQSQFVQGAHARPILTRKGLSVVGSVAANFVMLGGNGTNLNNDNVAWSADGLAWNASKLPSNGQWLAVVQGGSTLVAVRGDGTTAGAYSTDGGRTWNASTMPSGASWQGLAYGAGIFVATASSGSASAYSTDGINWIASSMPSAGSWNVAFGGGRFVAIGRPGALAAYSTDGHSWTASSLPAASTWISIGYGAGTFVALAYGAATSGAYSTDGGQTWSSMTIPSGYWNRVAYGAGVFSSCNNNDTHAIWSADGITWTLVNLPATNPLGNNSWNDIVFKNSKFVAVATACYTGAYSDDGKTWTAFTTTNASNWNAVG